MPSKEPLPDLLADRWKNYAYLRASSTYMSRQPADFLSISLTVSCIAVTIFRWDVVNVPRLAFTYNVCLAVRVLFFSVTGLPPACIGYPNCKCAVVPYAQVAKQYSIPKIAFIYSFAMGLFLGDLPQCGDLTMSGHTIYLWILAFYLLSALEKVLKDKLIILIKFVVYVLLSFVSATIIWIRNHYTIDIMLAIFFSNALWTLYGWMAELVHMKTSLSKTLGWKIFQWLEDQHDDSSEYSFSSTEL